MLFRFKATSIFLDIWISRFIYVFAATARLSLPVTFYFPSLRLNDRQDTISTSLGRFRILIEKDGRKKENKVK